MKLGQTSEVTGATHYGTIPTSTMGSYIDRVRETGHQVYAQRRPWAELFQRGTVGRPISFSDALERIRKNLSYFRVNYAMIVLGIVFLSLLWHPISLIVLIVLLVAWCFLYFFRTEPLVLCNRTLNEGPVLILLIVVTFVALLLTHATLTFCIGLLVGVVLIVLHAVFRIPGEFSMVEQEDASGGLMSVVGGLPISASRG